METHANALTPTLEYAGKPTRPQAATRSLQHRDDLPESDKRKIGEHAYPPCDPKGLVIAASAWLAFYVVATIHNLIAFGN